MKAYFLSFKKKYLQLLLENKKTTTIRKQNIFERDRIYPVRCGFFNKTEHYVKILSVKKKRVRELTEKDARLDGFSSIDELKEALRSIYSLKEDDYVYIYTLKFLSYKEKKN